MTLNYGLRYEINSRIKEAKHRTSIAESSGLQPANLTSFLHSRRQRRFSCTIPSPSTHWIKPAGDRAFLWTTPLSKHTTLHAGGAITTILPNLWQDNYRHRRHPARLPAARYRFAWNSCSFFQYPCAARPARALHHRRSTSLPQWRQFDVPANTQMDLQRFQSDLEALTPGHQVQLLTAGAISRGFRNGYIGTYTLGVDHEFRRREVQRSLRRHRRHPSRQRVLSQWLRRRRSRIRSVHSVRRLGARASAGFGP